MSNCKLCNIELNTNTQYASDALSFGLMCKECRKDKYNKNNTPEKQAVFTKTKRDKRKQEIYNHLGDHCKCCGETNKYCLTVDHILNDGAKERLATNGKNCGSSGSDRIYLLLKRNNFDQTRYQILCFNCNASKGFHGYCQHQIIQSKFCHFCAIQLSLDNQFNFHIQANISICKTCSKQVKNNTMADWDKNRVLEIRRKLIEAYGKKCKMCNEDKWCFLSIDHINNNGAQERKELPGIKLYRNIIANNFPNTYQLLCYNCNCGIKQLDPQYTNQLVEQISV